MPKFSINNFTKRNKFTRMCIGDAIISLMKEKTFDKIKILDIALKAGVSRMTFYKYYHSKEAVLNDYLKEIVSEYIDNNSDALSKNFSSYESILNALNYFDEFSDFFLVLAHSGLYYLLIDAINQYMEERIIPNYNFSPYRVYYYAGGLLNIFVKWEETGKKESAEEIAKSISSLDLYSE